MREKILGAVLRLVVVPISVASLAAAPALSSPSKRTPVGLSPRPVFLEVNPLRTSRQFKNYVIRALERLRDHPTRIGRLTYESIRDGRILIDEFGDLTRADFWRVRRDLLRWDVELSFADYRTLQEPGSAAEGAITATIDGYQWADRVYVSWGHTPRGLAATLVHEVNHVLNRVERDYHNRWPVNAFVHEYRAIYAEKLLDPEQFRGVDLADYVIDLYEFDRSAIPADVLESPLDGAVLPTEVAWFVRDLEDGQSGADTPYPFFRTSGTYFLSLFENPRAHHSG